MAAASVRPCHKIQPETYDDVPTGVLRMPLDLVAVDLLLDDCYVHQLNVAAVLGCLSSVKLRASQALVVSLLVLCQSQEGR